MLDRVTKNWQQRWGAALALVALLAWCMPTLAMGCAIGAMTHAEMVNCSEMHSDVLSGTSDVQQMPCCNKIPLPSSSSSETHSAVLSTDGHLQILEVAYPPPYTPLWTLPIKAPGYGVDIKSAFFPETFSPPPTIYVTSQLYGRAPPFLI